MKTRTKTIAVDFAADFVGWEEAACQDEVVRKQELRHRAEEASQAEAEELAFQAWVVVAVPSSPARLVEAPWVSAQIEEDPEKVVAGLPPVSLQRIVVEAREEAYLSQPEVELALETSASDQVDG